MNANECEHEQKVGAKADLQLLCYDCRTVVDHISMNEKKKIAVIIGAGPAGLTAAYELLTRTDIKPIVIERDAEYVGGISRTVKWNGNRIDLGGHRFFSKSDRVMKWWSEILPVELDLDKSTDITYQRTTRALTDGMRMASSADGENVLRVRPRKTRILYGGKLFAYPVELSFDTLSKLGPVKVVKIGWTYMWSRLFPRKPETTLEDFFINRFGTELYKTFFKSYTEKVWGVPCRELSAEWGAQRIKSLSVSGAIAHAIKKLLHAGPLAGKSVETSLIEQFLYPVYGPGQLWERVADQVQSKGGEVRMGESVVGIESAGSRVTSVQVQTKAGTEIIDADYVFSTTDVRLLAQIFNGHLPAEVEDVAGGLQYRDFLTVGLLLDAPLVEADRSPFLDTWMYVHEPGVNVGRVQFFNNWSPQLLADQSRGWVGLEYFCAEGDALWNMRDEDLVAFAGEELAKIGLLRDRTVIGGVVIRQPKAYPSYTGTYDRLSVVRDHFNQFENLFLIGRNGMHRYNNQDHSMLAAMMAVDNIIAGRTDKSALWSINSEEDYHEEKRTGNTVS